MRPRNLLIATLLAGLVAAGCSKDGMTTTNTPKDAKDTKDTKVVPVEPSAPPEVKEEFSFMTFEEIAPHFTNREFLELRLLGDEWQLRGRRRGTVNAHGGGFSQHEECSAWQDIPQTVVAEKTPVEGMTCESHSSICPLIARQRDLPTHEGLQWKIDYDLTLTAAACN